MLVLAFVSLSAAAGGLAAYLALTHAVDALRDGRGVNRVEALGLFLARGAWSIIVLLLGWLVLDVGVLQGSWRLWVYLAALILGTAGYGILLLNRNR